MKRSIRILVVDDSAFARHSIARELQKGAGIEVVGFARNGIEAVEKVKSLKPDVVTMDVEMPEMNGLQALQYIMREEPTPVIMVSSLTAEGAETTIKALELGAVDYYLKVSPADPLGNFAGNTSLPVKAMMAANTHLCKQIVGILDSNKNPLNQKTNPKDSPDIVVVIGTSTGGPKALYQVVPALPGDLSAAVLVVQHMPPGFTNSLAARLNQLSNLFVKEAAAGDHLLIGQVLVAPGGYHMKLESKGNISLNKDPAVCGVRPSVDVTMLSAAAAMGKSVVAVVMTGMGSDGTNGTTAIHLAGGMVIAESEETSVVYGMPKCVIDAGNADKVVSLHQIPSEIVKLVKELKNHDRT